MREARGLILLGEHFDAVVERALPGFSPLWPQHGRAAVRQLAGDVVAGIFATIARGEPDPLLHVLEPRFHDWVDRDLPARLFERAVEGTLDALASEAGTDGDLPVLDPTRRERLQGDVLRAYHGVFRSHFKRQVRELHLLNGLGQVGGGVDDLADNFLNEAVSTLDADFGVLMVRQEDGALRRERTPDHFFRFSRAKLDLVLAQATEHDPALMQSMEKIFARETEGHHLASPFDWDGLEAATDLPEGLVLAPDGPQALVGRIQAASLMGAVVRWEERDLGYVAVVRETDPPFTRRDWAFFETATGEFVRILETRRLQRELRRLATTDPLTGLLNRRRFFELADLEAERADRYGRTYSVLMIDADKFKSVNDIHGHPTGDRVLKALSDTLAHRARRGDLVARYGGEEFVVLLLEAGAAAARRVAEDHRERCKRIRVANDQGEEVSFTVSIGVAVHPVHGGTLQEVLTAADKALYDAKEGGRDRVALAP